MRNILVLLGLLSSFNLLAQTEVDGVWKDNDLNFRVEWEDLKRKGEMDLCIEKVSEGRCVGNVFTSFEVIVYDAGGREINKSIWSGLNMELKFRTPLPEAHHLVIRAVKPFVINALTKNKIYQDQPMVLTYRIP